MRTVLLLVAAWGVFIAVGSAVFLVVNQLARPSLYAAVFNLLGMVAGTTVALTCFRRARGMKP